MPRMALKATINDVEFGVGDVVRVTQKIQEDENKTRLQAFEGMVLGIKGRGTEKTFTVRRIGAQRVGIERIFPVSSPVISTIEVIRRGLEGTRSAKLFFTRKKAKRDIEAIYSRANKRTHTKA
jgi:large subunit ribosomal protein L19